MAVMATAELQEPDVVGEMEGVVRGGRVEALFSRRCDEDAIRPTRNLRRT